MKFELYKEVALASDIPEHRLKRGDIAKVVEYLPPPNGGEPGYALEVFNAVGESIDVLIVGESEIEPLSPSAVWHEREMAKAA